MCSALTSFVALVVVYNEKFYWWLDGLAGLLVAFYTLYSGAVTMTSSSVREFSHFVAE
jgi:divalent metal cation (Fe/Co/Zn/Cd) transporter